MIRRQFLQSFAKFGIGSSAALTIVTMTSRQARACGSWQDSFLPPGRPDLDIDSSATRTKNPMFTPPTSSGSFITGGFFWRLDRDKRESEAQILRGEFGKRFGK